MCYSIDVARAFAESRGADIAFSTDSREILDVAVKCGLTDDYVRPPELGNDVVGKPDVIKDVMLFYEKKNGKTYDCVVDLDVTSPIRTLHDVDRCVALLADNPEALTVFSVNPCNRNPYFNMVQQETDGFFHVVLGGRYTTRQSAPKVYDMNASIYVYRREALDCPNPRAVTDRSLVYVMDHVCFDLDEPEDFDYLEYLVERNKVRLI